MKVGGSVVLNFWLTSCIQLRLPFSYVDRNLRDFFRLTSRKTSDVRLDSNAHVALRNYLKNQTLIIYKTPVTVFLLDRNEVFLDTDSFAFLS